MTLAETQQAFSAWLRTGATERATAFGDHVQSGLDIYQNNYRAQLAACLEDSFAITRQWIGGEAFHDAVVRHVDRMPPGSWTLDAYPRDFPATLMLIYPDDPEVAELADLELALVDAFVAPDADAVKAEQVTTIDWDRAVLYFTPTLDLRPVSTNAAEIWMALTAEDTPPAASLLAQPGALMTWRHGETSQFRVIDAIEHQGILLARSGVSFANLCARLVTDVGEADGVALAGAWLGCWLAEGLIVTIEEV